MIGFLASDLHTPSQHVHSLVCLLCIHQNAPSIATLDFVSNFTRPALAAAPCIVATRGTRNATSTVYIEKSITNTCQVRGAATVILGGALVVELQTGSIIIRLLVTTFRMIAVLGHGAVIGIVGCRVGAESIAVFRTRTNQYLVARGRVEQLPSNDIASLFCREPIPWTRMRMNTVRRNAAKILRTKFLLWELRNE
jgi:hypothetical protein